MNKALLESAPFLVLGLLAMAWCAARATEPLLRAVALVCGATIVFLSVRDPDPKTLAGAIVGFSLSPRYLSESLPLLFLLATWSVRGFLPRGRLGAGIATAAALGGALGARRMFVLFESVDGDYDLHKRWVLLVGSLGIAALVAGSYAVARAVRAVWRAPSGRVAATVCTALAWLPFVLANGYATAATGAEDANALRSIAALYGRWTDAVARELPDRAVLVGDGRAKDGVFSVRAAKDVVFVDFDMDRGEDLVRVLRALAATGRPIFYFGSGIEKIRDRIAPEFEPKAVLRDPILVRLDPKRR